MTALLHHETGFGTHSIDLGALCGITCHTGRDHLGYAEAHFEHARILFDAEAMRDFVRQCQESLVAGQYRRQPDCSGSVCRMDDE